MADHQDPLKELLSVQRRMNALFEDALSRTNYEAEGLDAWEPSADLFTTPGGWHVELELPGMDPDEIDVAVEGDRLVVTGLRRRDAVDASAHFHRVECTHGRFERKFHIPVHVDRDSIRAQYRDGVLAIDLPMRAGSSDEGFRVRIQG